MAVLALIALGGIISTRQRPAAGAAAASFGEKNPSAAWLTFTYEEGDVIGGFAAKVGHALNAMGIATLTRPNWQGADFFWHSGYRPTRWTPNVFYWQNVYFNLENFHVDASKGETLLQTRHADPDQVGNHRVHHVPWAWVAFEHRKQTPNATYLLRPRHYDAAKKTRFCAFAASYCNYERDYLKLYGGHLNGIKQPRTEFFETLNKSYPRRRIDALGPCYHNRDEPPVPEEYKARYPGWTIHDSFIYLMRDYKFVMSFENMATPGYFTEKLFNAYLGGALPIYWGDPRVDELVNTEAFIWCREHPEDPRGRWARCIDRIIELDNDPVAYAKVFEQPILKNNRIPEWMSYEVLARKLLTGWNMVVPGSHGKHFRRPPHAL